MNKTPTTKTGIEKRPGRHFMIETGSDYITVRENGRYCNMYDVSSFTDHLEAVKYVAARYFGAGEGKLRRVDSGCVLPCPGFARWGWTRENRAVGEVSIHVDYYKVILEPDTEIRF